MRKFFGIVGGLLSVMPAMAQTSAPPVSPALVRADESATAQQTHAVVMAAQSFLSTLDAQKRAAVELTEKTAQP